MNGMCHRLVRIEIVDDAEQFKIGQTSCRTAAVPTE